MKNIFRKITNRFVFPHSQLVYAQSGEDLIVAHLFYKLGIKKPYYLDIGANHPIFISNTYYFYLRGGRGVCVEPNPYLFKKIKAKRPGDIVLNAGVGIDRQIEADFYLFPKKTHGLSTFSKREADYWKETGMRKEGKIAYERIIKVPLHNINTIIHEYCSRTPDFISIDIEGLDLAVLQTFNFETYTPLVFCVETLCYDEKQNEYKNKELIEFMIVNGYQVYADTHVNTIFLKV